MVYENAILVREKGEVVKWFKVWFDEDTSRARVRIVFKDDAGEKQVIEKEYKQTKQKVAVIACTEAVIKYWPKFDPQRHELIHSSGHKHEVRKRS
jgi:hypothetical protein